ncbi:conserved hypothetical protein [Histoplasma capsulatum G186AR]|uniref:HNH nuclease domain-containing protein n=1 Tax=Ajellomyces capsulatus (strain G186AR / H82 / ATCC MYA-2454 / RMSCC 2432) TaxID=447093 RepID=C0NWN8_AJECG|nr:uncharacterized protein HCBG_07568 [Histoplasma capsulatum G186AR]EEH04343.1 conserved hypothetical protein [Histoplasma capsulatum G186AR]
MRCPNSFCSSRHGPDLTGISDSILTEDSYFFFVIDDPGFEYPIVPSFLDWRFPHDHIPDVWLAAHTHVAPQNDAGVGQCGISGISLSVDTAHLVPREADEWYAMNAIYLYSDASPGDINNLANTVQLASHIHRSFDDRLMVIVPELSEEGSDSGPVYRFVAHILQPRGEEFWSNYHNIIVQYLNRFSGPYLFGRFAWAVLFLAKPFILRRVPRSVVRVKRSPQGEVLGYEGTTLTGAQLQSLYGFGGSRSSRGKSLKTHSVADDASECTQDIDINMNYGSNYGVIDLIDDWEERGRKQLELEHLAKADRARYPETAAEISLVSIYPYSSTYKTIFGMEVIVTDTDGKLKKLLLDVNTENMLKWVRCHEGDGKVVIYLPVLNVVYF